MSSTSDQFTEYVNLELPKRISTEESPMSVPVGSIPVATGVGLGVVFKDPSAIGGPESFEELGVGLVTAQQIPLNDNGTVELPSKPYGGILLNTAIIHLQDGSIVEVMGVYLQGRTLSFTADDLASITNPVAVTVSYIGNITPPP